MKIFLIIALLQLFLVNTYAQTVTEFGCTFDDSNYNINANKWKSLWPIEPRYGNVQHGNLNFNDKDDFKEFYSKVEKIRNDLLSSGKYTYNTVEPFAKFYNDYDKSDHKSFRTFYKTYMPKFTSLDAKRPPAGTSWNGLIWIYRDLVKYRKEVMSEFTLATCDQNVAPDKIKKLGADYPEEPPSWFHHDLMAGVIHFTIENKDHGYLVIDLTCTVYPTPVLMEDPKHDLHKYKVRSKSYDKSVHYELVQGKTNTRPSYIRMMFIETGINKVTIQLSRVLFIRKSLCSFATIEKAALLNPLKEIFRFDNDGLVGYLGLNLIFRNETKYGKNKVVNVWGNIVKMAYYDKETDKNNMCEQDLVYFLLLRRSPNKCAETVIKRLQLSKEDTEKQLDTIGLVHDTNPAFIKAIYEWYGIIVRNRNLSMLKSVYNHIKTKVLMSHDDVSKPKKNPQE